MLFPVPRISRNVLRFVLVFLFESIECDTICIMIERIGIVIVVQCFFRTIFQASVQRTVAILFNVFIIIDIEGSF